MASIQRVMQVSSQLFDQQRAQTMENMGGLQRQFAETMQGTSRGMHM